MQCFVYKSARKADTYIYLRARDDFAVLPPAISDALGPFTFVMQFELTAERKLARESAHLVTENLRGCGFHLQLPPPVEPQPTVGDS
jgi:uncharacterized protein YcgL (UPF0745 family)